MIKKIIFLHLLCSFGDFRFFGELRHHVRIFYPSLLFVLDHKRNTFSKILFFKRINRE